MKRIVTALMSSFLFRCFFSFSASFKSFSPWEKVEKLLFVLGLVGRVSVSIIVAKYSIFPRADNGRSREKKFWQSNLLTPSECTVEIWSTLTYTEFDCVALLAKL